MTNSKIDRKTILKAEDLEIGYREGSKAVKILQSDLQLQLHIGELVCLIGPNGTGKSTMIRTLGGLQRPLKGNVLIKENNIRHMGANTRSELLGIILTDRTTVDNISVFEIVSLGRFNVTNWIGTLGTDDKKKVFNAIRTVGLEGFEDRLYGSLSDGEKQRAFIAKILASEAKVLLLDEPTVHLDIPNRVEILSLLRKLTRNSGYSVLVSTHELDLALKVADKIWLLGHDQLFFTGTPGEVIQSGYLDELFGNEIYRFKKEYDGKD